MLFSLENKRILIRNIPDALRIIADYLEGSLIEEFELDVNSNLKRKYPSMGVIRGESVDIALKAKFRDPKSYEVLEYRIDDLR